MPELPEIETIRQRLEKSVRGARIVKARADDPLIITPSAARRLARVAKGQTIDSLGRCGKVLIVGLSGGWSVLQRFGMTGQMYPQPGAEALPPHTRMVWELADGRRLVYRDARRFGETLVVKTAEVPTVLVEDCRLGHDALEPKLKESEFAALLAEHSTPIETFLLDQTHLAGIGNIYAAEILHRARISPLRPANRLTPKETRLLLRLIGEVMAEAVAGQGTTISDYAPEKGETGGFQELLRVYGREGERCRRRGCPGRVERIVQAQRSTFFCPECQQ